MAWRFLKQDGHTTPDCGTVMDSNKAVIRVDAYQTSRYPGETCASVWIDPAKLPLILAAPELLEQVNLDRATLGHVKFRLETEADLIGKYDKAAKAQLLSLAKECFDACQAMTEVVNAAIGKVPTC